MSKALESTRDVPSYGAVNARLPVVRAIRFEGPAAKDARLSAPLGATILYDADAIAIVLGPADASSPAAIARILPEPSTLEPGTLVVVLPNVIEPPSLTSRLRSAFGRGPVAPRAVRASALVSRGYINVAAGLDPASRSDLVWGYA